jgi:hypothetical protein
MEPPWNDDSSWRWSILLTFENLNDTRDNPRSPDSQNRGRVAPRQEIDLANWLESLGRLGRAVIGFPNWTTMMHAAVSS